MTTTPADPADLTAPTLPAPTVNPAIGLVAEERPTSQEVSLSLTGYEEIAIQKAFGVEPTDLRGNKPARALAFILYKRDGMTHDEAYKAVMGATIKTCTDLFADTDDDDEGDKDLGLETPGGKGDASPANGPTS